MSGERLSTETVEPRCGTCGMVYEEPDENIAPGDYWQLGAWDDPRRCPECRRFPPRDVVLPPATRCDGHVSLREWDACPICNPPGAEPVDGYVVSLDRTNGHIDVRQATTADVVTPPGQADPS